LPIYEYNCHNCGQRVEVLILAGRGDPACPNCGAPLSDRLISTPNVIGRHYQRAPGSTCCGREERCDLPPCGDDDSCRRA
jgi:putative FmdB family regulatory protein